MTIRTIMKLKAQDGSVAARKGLRGSRWRERIGFLAGGLLGLLAAELVARGLASSAGPGLWLLGFGLGAGIGRSLAAPRSQP